MQVLLINGREKVVVAVVVVVVRGSLKIIQNAKIAKNSPCAYSACNTLRAL